MAILDKIKNKKEEAPKAKAEKKVETTPKISSVKKVTAKDTSNAFKVIVKPVVSEKSNSEEAKGKYTFIVAINTNKVEIKKAINDIYGVLPLKVRTSITDGKVKRFGRSRGRRSSFKKAVVTLPKGKTINIHEGV
ncbi:MAG: 50S ribosomal protein L23 [Candidatus Magasanikbacteria bacterium]|nr:50S ribosomal protein L23 [Candidatus Magasanikbacteria bacterium]